MAENPLLVTMTQKHYEMVCLLEERRRLFEMAKRALENDDLHGCLGVMIGILERIQVNDERYVELHRHCLAMLEQGGKILELDAMRRPVVVHLESQQASEESKK